VSTTTRSILGPDGEPLGPAAGTQLEPFSRQITHREAIDLVKSGRAYTPEAVLEVQKAAGRVVPRDDDLIGHAYDVEKRGDDRRGARSQGVSFTSIWDRNRGKPKPTPITVETLRLMSNRAEWVRAIIKTRKNQIGKVPWAIVPKDKDDKSASTEKLIERLTKMFKRPQMYGSRPTSMSWRHFIGMLLEDVLVLDAGCIEKERTRGGSICALYPVDGATIRPNIDEKGGYYDDAYVQVVDGVVTARFGMEELVYIADNPQTDVRFAGYGLSPLENLVITVTAELYASKFNASYFEKGAVPEGLLNLGEDVPPEDVDAFRLYWMNEVMGKPWAIPILAGKGVEWVQWRDNNRDMQFMEYQTWLLKKACAVYQISPQEVGLIEDVNRSTADSQEGTNESKSIEPILSLLKDAIDVEIIGEHGEGVGDWVEFEWESEGASAEEVNAKFQPAVEAGAATRAEWREELGMDTPEEGTPGAEGLDMFLTSGDVKPLPSKEDAELLSTAKQQEREDEQAQKEAEGAGQPSDMPWKPGEAGNPAIAAAQREHDDANDIGVRHNGPPPDVGKVAPHTRDTAPGLTARQDDLSGILREKQHELLTELSGILGLPADELLEAVQG
jgi:phage portal protein BeeE